MGELAAELTERVVRDDEGIVPYGIAIVRHSEAEAKNLTSPLRRRCTPLGLFLLVQKLRFIGDISFFP